MGILDSIERRAFSPENPKTSLDRPASWLTQLFSSSQSAGVTVTSETAVSSSTVYACVRLLSETFASLPLVLYRQDGKKKEKATDHPLYWLLHTEPNKMMSSFKWRESEYAKLLLWGNSYSEIVLNQADKIMALLPLNPRNVTPFTLDNEKYYRVNLSIGETVVPNAKILHIAGFGFSGILGLNPVETNKSSIGLSLAAEKFSSNLFRNGVRPSGILEHPLKLSTSAINNLKESFEERYSGVDNSNKPMVLEEGMKWTQLGLSPGDAQILETRKFQISDIARIFNVPPHMIGDLERSTNNNIEQQSLEFVTYSLRSGLVRWESELNRLLIPEKDRQNYYFKFISDALLRGDTKTRFESYNLGRNMGLYSTNEIREKEDMNPVEHGDDDYILPLNVGLAGQVAQNINPNGGTNNA